MAVDYYLELEGIKGESQDKDHKDQIEVLSWSWGMTQTGSGHSGTGSASGRANFQDVSLTKIMDKASVTLQQYCATGKHIPTGKLVCYKASGDNRVKYFVMDMKKVYVSSYSTGGVSEGGLQTENLSLNLGEFKDTYTQQMADGSAGASVDFGYDIAGHKAV